MLVKESKQKLEKSLKISKTFDFDKKCHEIYRNWYIDGRLYYHKMIDVKKPEEGIKELKYIDPLNGMSDKSKR